eukprot:scaffold20356_cov125-Isochrysis_galbana.AAC.10
MQDDEGKHAAQSQEDLRRQLCAAPQDPLHTCVGQIQLTLHDQAHADRDHRSGEAHDHRRGRASEAAIGYCRRHAPTPAVASCCVVLGGRAGAGSGARFLFMPNLRRKKRQIAVDSSEILQN